MAIACSECATIQELPRLVPGAQAICRRCENRLERTAGRSVTAALACSLATFALLFPANLLPLMHVSLLGSTRQTQIYSGIVALWDHQWIIIAILVALFVMALPLVRFGLLTLVLIAVRAGAQPRWLGRGFRWAMHLDPWAMPDVFLLGGAVGYSRVAANLPVTVDAGGGCLIGAALLCMLTRASLDRRTVWSAIAPESPMPPAGTPITACSVCDLVMTADCEASRCPRCDARICARKRDALLRTLALVIAGFALYIPANLLPMSVDEQLGYRVTHRIVDGIMDLFRAGLWPLGVLIFCTSIAIPLLKLVGLSWFLVSTWQGSRQRLVRKTQLYRLIEEIGRWSNIDVFTIAVFVPLLQFGALASADAAAGATAFMLVVVLSMIAARVFDPRMMWDAALERAHERG